MPRLSPVACDGRRLIAIFRAAQKATTTMTPTPFRPSRRELIRWAAATSILSGVPLGCGAPTKTSKPVAPWKPAFLTADELLTLEALADTIIVPEADGTGGGKSLGAGVFVDRLLTALDGAP